MSLQVQCDECHSYTVDNPSHLRRLRLQTLRELDLLLGDGTKLSRGRCLPGDSTDRDVNCAGDLTARRDPITNLVGNELECDDAGVFSVALVYAIF